MKRYLIAFYRSLLLTMVSVASMSAWAQSSGFAGGVGSPTDPFLISNEQQFAVFLTSGNDLTANYKLTADIAVTSYSESLLLRTTLKGSFDGDGHTISGLTNSLFSSVNGGKVINLKLICNMVGDAPQAPLCMNAIGAFIKDVSASGTIIARQQVPVGGIAAITANSSSFINCSSSVQFSGSGLVGGICGYDSDSSADYVNCSSSYSVICSNRTDVVNNYSGDGPEDGTSANPYKIGSETELLTFASKFMGPDNDNGGYYYQKFYVLTSDITLTNGMPQIPHFEGTLDGAGHTISGLKTAMFSDASGAIFKNLCLDGTITDGMGPQALLCLTSGGGTFNNVSVSGSISIAGSPSPVGGICAQVPGGSTFTNCTSSVSIACPTGSEGLYGGICGIVQSPESVTFTGCSSSVVYKICGNMENPSEVVTSLGGSGTEYDPYIISNEAELRFLSENYNKPGPDGKPYYIAYFKITKDIPLQEYFTPINEFHGVIDGDGHTISGISTYNLTQTSFLIGDASASMIKNLKLQGSIDYDGGDIAFLCMYAGSNTYFNNIEAYGTIKSVNTQHNGTDYYVGGICAKSAGVVFQACKSYVTMTANTGVAGGICGYDLSGETQFHDCVSSADVTALVAGPILGSSAVPGYTVSDDNTVIDPGVVPGETNPNFAGGTGTKDDPYQIATAVQFNYLAQSYNVKDDYTGNVYSTEYYVLTNDITLIGGTPSIGEFSGTLDGGNHTISGLDRPLIASLTGTVKNLNVAGEIPGGDVTGMLCSRAENASVSSVSASGTIGSTNVLGGICGSSWKTKFVSCSSDITLTGSNKYVGGICGEDIEGSSFKNCHASNAYTGLLAGGILGYTAKVESLVLGTDNTNPQMVRLCGNIGDDVISTLQNTTFFAGGSGTFDDPWLIKTKEQMAKLAENFENYDQIGRRYEDCHYKLIADIDITDCGYAGSQYGAFAYGTFTGTFNGNHHKISGITMPLIYIINGASVFDLEIEGSVINNTCRSIQTYGLLAWSAERSTFNNVKVSGTVTANYESDSQIGGIVGSSNLSSFASCQANVQLRGGNAITDSFISGPDVGGIVGRSISSSFVNCTTSGNYIEGITVGGIVGYDFTPSSSHVSTFSGCSSSATMSVSTGEGKEYYLGYVIGFKTERDDFVIGFDNVYTGTQTDLKIYGNYVGPKVYFAGGTGTKVDPYLIANETHLRNFAYVTRSTEQDERGLYYRDAYYKITSDITLTSVWEPGGNCYAKIDGNGKTISGLTHVLALGFDGAEIKDLTLVVDINQDEVSVGALACSIYNSNITNVHVQGSVVSPSNSVGGLAGVSHNSKFVNCSSSAIVTSGWSAGGICGESGYNASSKNGSSFTECVSNATLTGKFVGGICGMDNGSSSFYRCESYAKFEKLDDRENYNWWIGSILGETIDENNLILRSDNKYFGSLEIRLCGNREDDIIDEYFAIGNGVKNDPYSISSEADLRTLAQVITSGLSNRDGVKYSDAYYSVTKDIEIKNAWTTIPGTFTGRIVGGGEYELGKKISGLTAPLFEKIKIEFGPSTGNNPRSVFNLNLSGDISSDKEKVGLLCCETETAIIEKVTVTGSISSVHPAAKVGGICGYSLGTNILNSTSNASVTGTFVGGFVGYDKKTTRFDDCTSVCTVTVSGTADGDTYRGYILGYSESPSDLSLVRIYNKGTDKTLWPCGNIEPEADKFAAGDGTPGDPYIIATLDQFKNFLQAVNDDSDPDHNPEFRDKHYVLACDVDLSQSEGLHTISGQFCGTLDGKYNDEVHTISGMNFCLFEDVVSAKIQNLKLQGELIGSGSRLSAFLCGYTHLSEISNVSVSGSIKSASWVGAGIVNYSSYSVFRSCSFEGSISAETTVGGICGEDTESQFFDCVAADDVVLEVTGEDEVFVGGILGYQDIQGNPYVAKFVIGKDNICPINYWRCGNIKEYKTVFEGAGTADEPYLIETASQLYELSEAVDNYAMDEDNEEYASKNYKLVNDIVVDDKFTSIGYHGSHYHKKETREMYIAQYYDNKKVTSSNGESYISRTYGFHGCFDGNNKSISGLECALFDYISGDALVKNLSLKANIVNNSEFATSKSLYYYDRELDYQYLGILANVAVNGLVVDGVTVDGSILGETVKDKYNNDCVSVAGGLIGLVVPLDDLYQGNYAVRYNGDLKDLDITIKNTTVNVAVEAAYAGLVIGESENSRVTDLRLRMGKDFVIKKDDMSSPKTVHLGVTLGEMASAKTTRDVHESYFEENVYSDVTVLTEAMRLAYNNMMVGRSVPNNLFEGRGTEKSPILIKSPEDYYRVIKIYFNAISESDQNYVGLDDKDEVYTAPYSSLNYKITTDLDFTGKVLDVKAEGYNESNFIMDCFNLDEKGSLTAKDITIKNLVRQNVYTPGFIGTNAGTVTMENVTFKNVTLGGTVERDNPLFKGLGFGYDRVIMLGTVVAENTGTINLNNVNIENLSFNDWYSNSKYFEYAGGYVGKNTGNLVVNTKPGSQSTITGTFDIVHSVDDFNYKYRWGGAVGHATGDADNSTELNNVISYVHIPEHTAANAIIGTVEFGRFADAFYQPIRISNCYDMSEGGDGNLVELMYGHNATYRYMYRKGYLVNNDAEAGIDHLLGSTDNTFCIKHDDYNKMKWDDDNPVYETSTFSSTGSGCGSSFEPYLICDKNDFLTFLKAVHQNYFSVDGVNCTKNIRVKIMHDLNFAGDERLTDIDGEIIDGKTSDFTSYTDGGIFNGYIDGNGMTISGLTMPLFAKLEGATVKNLGIVDSNIDGFALCGAAKDCTFEGCYVSGNTNGLVGTPTNGNTLKDCYAYNTKTKVYTPVGDIDNASFYAANEECNISGHPILKSASYKLIGSDSKTYYSDATLVIPTDNKMYYYESPTRLHRLEGINYNSWSEQVLDGKGQATEVHDRVSAVDYYYVLKHYYTEYEDSYTYADGAKAKWSDAKPHGMNPLVDNVCLLHNVWRDGEYFTNYSGEEVGYKSVDEFDHVRYIYSLYLTDKKDLGFDPNKVLTRIRNIHYQRTTAGGGLNTVFLPFPFNATDVKKADGTPCTGVKAYMLADRIKIDNKTGQDEYYYDRNTDVWDYYSDEHNGKDYDRLFFVQLTNKQMDDVTAGLPMLLDVKEEEWHIDLKDLGTKYGSGADHRGTTTDWDDKWANNKYALFASCAMKDGDNYNMRYHADIEGEDQMGYSFRTIDNMGSDFAHNGHAANLGTFTTIPKGVLKSKESADGYNFFKLNSSGNAYVQVTENSSVQPFRTYVSIHASNNSKAKKTSFGMGSANYGFVDDEEELATDMKSLEQQGITILTLDQQKIYSLDGNQVGTLSEVKKLKSGIYIMNGKKFVKK